VRQIFKTAAFSFDDQIIEKYLNPSVVSISQALGSPENKMKSIQGEVIKVYLLSVAYKLLFRVKDKYAYFDYCRNI